MMTNKKLRVFMILMTALLIVLTGCERINRTRETVTEFTSTITSIQQMQDIMEEHKEVADFSAEDIEELVEYGRLAVEHAQKIDYDFLNEIYPDLGTNFEDNLVKGIDLMVKGYQENNQQLADEGAELIESWGNWFEENVENIRPLSFLKDRLN